MKKLISISASFLISLALFGCGETEQTPPQKAPVKRIQRQTQPKKVVSKPVVQKQVTSKKTETPISITKTVEKETPTPKSEEEKASFLNSLKDVFTGTGSTVDKEEPEEITPKIDPASIPTEEDALSYKDAETCRDDGGSWIRGQDTERSFMCLKPFPDAGKSCEDEKDCYGKCLGRLDETTDEYIGHCQKNNNPFGCFVFMKNGKAQEEECIQ